MAVLLPGLGLPHYMLRTAGAVARRGVECVVLDLPGFGARGARTVCPVIESIATAASSWVLSRAQGRPVVVVGHSTGAQAALGAALALQPTLSQTALVMAGPTFRPEHRRPLRLLAATPLAYRDETLGELTVVPDIARGHLGVLSILRSAMRDAPEVRLAGLHVPLTLTAGRRDAYAPRSWLAELAHRATRSPSVRILDLPGSHNNLYTHPDAFAAVVTGALSAP